MTIGELIKSLQQYNKNQKIYINCSCKHSDGYADVEVVEVCGYNDILLEATD